MSEGNDSQGVRDALRNAARHLEQGERPEAAGWYRRAARLLSEEGDDERAVEYGVLAADLEDDDEANAPVPLATKSVRPGAVATAAPAVAPAPARTSSLPLPMPDASRPAARTRADTGRHKPPRAGAKADATGRHKSQGAGGSTRGATGRHKAIRDVDVPIVLERSAAPKQAEAIAPPSPPAPPIQKSGPPPTPPPAAPVPRPPIAPPPRASVPPVADASVRPPSPIAMPARPSDPHAPVPPDTASRRAPPPTPSLPGLRAADPHAPVPPDTASRRAPPPTPSLPGGSLPRPQSSPTSSSQPLPTMGVPHSPVRPGADPVAVVTLASSAATWSVPPPPTQASRIDLVRALLPSLRCLDELNSDRVRELARQVQVLACDDGEVCFTTGAPTGPLLIVTSGNVHIDRPGAFAFDVVLGEGATLGVLSALYGSSRLATARARGPVEAFAFAPSLARSLAREFGSFRRFVEKAATQHAAALLPHLSPALRTLSPAAQGRVIEACEYVPVEDGALLQLESAPSRALHFVAAGAVERFGEGVPAGTVLNLGPGALVGGTALGDEALAPWTARAAGPVLLARIDRVAYRALIAEFPGVREALRDGPGT